MVSFETFLPFENLQKAFSNGQIINYYVLFSKGKTPILIWFLKIYFFVRKQNTIYNLFFVHLKMLFVHL